MSAVIRARSYSGFQPHSVAGGGVVDRFRPGIGDGLPEIGLVRHLESGMCFLISAASSPALKLMAATLKSAWCLSPEKSASIRSSVALRQSGMYIMGRRVSSREEACVSLFLTASKKMATA